MTLAGLVLALVGVGTAADTAREAATAAVFEGLVRGDEPGLAVLVRQDGKTVFERGYGVRDLRSRERIDPGTSFRLASVTKQLTATAVMLLVRDGKLRYEDALTDLVPAFPAYGKGIRVRHLLTHTSGLPDYEDLMTAAEQGRPPIWTSDRQIHDDKASAGSRSLARSTADVAVRRDDRVPHGDRALPGRPAHGRDPRQPQRPRPGRARAAGGRTVAHGARVSLEPR